jgi:hypothetical protein
MDQYFGSLDLFEGGAEARNESVGKVADEAYGIAKGLRAQRRTRESEELRQQWDIQLDFTVSVILHQMARECALHLVNLCRVLRQ